MNDLYFYNHDRKPRIQCCFLALKKMNRRDVLYFTITAEVSVFSAYTQDVIYIEDLMSLQKKLSLLYQHKKDKISFTSLNDVLKIDLEYLDSGHIIQRFYIREKGTQGLLMIEDYFDQTFLPELNENIDKILENKDILENCPIQIDDNRRKISVQLCNFLKGLSSDYFYFNIQYMGNVFTFSMRSEAYVKELLQFRDDISALLGNRRNECVFNPLGEFYFIKLVKKSDIILECDVSDTSCPQNNLMFHETVDTEVLKNIINQIELHLLDSEKEKNI